MTVLVTGGAGYIGSHTCKALASAGILPVTLDNLSTGHKWAVKWGPLVTGDLRDGLLLQRTLRAYHVQAVLHFAASASVGESVSNPAKYYRNNLINSLTLFEAMRTAGVRQLVFSSSCATYGIPKTDLIHEDHPQAPVNPYGETKLAIERALGWFGSAYGFRSVILRYFNAAGADTQQELGEDHDPETHLIPLAIAAALHPNRPLSIFGTDYPTPDGTAIRDYVHVTDLAAAHVLAVEQLRCGAPGASYNLGTERGYSVYDVVNSVQQITGRKVSAVQCARRQGDPPKLVATAALAREILGWRPRLSSLDSIVSSAWRWTTRTTPSLAASAATGSRHFDQSPWAASDS